MPLRDERIEIFEVLSDQRFCVHHAWWENYRLRSSFWWLRVWRALQSSRSEYLKALCHTQGLHVR